MKALIFMQRTTKEILRDPLTLLFGIGFPVIVLLLLSAIQANVPESLFPLNILTPGIAVFGLSFLSLFAGLLIARDRTSAFLTRLYASPLKARDYLIGYTIPFIPIGLAQGTVSFLVSMMLGLTPDFRIILSIASLIPTIILHIALGMLAGTLLNDKQVGGICGALLTNLSAWLSGAWFDISLIGGIFEKLARSLPFYHGVEAARMALAGSYSQMGMHLIWVASYAIILAGIAVIAFRKQMTS